MPTERLEGGTWPHPARLPLGCGWTGHCTAPGHENEVPQLNILETFCNLGYAGPCNWAPAQRAWDAVRFAVLAPPDTNASPRAAIGPTRELRLIYVCERDHHPVHHGDLLFDLSTGTWLRRHDDLRIQKMAECYLDSYLKKKA